MLKQYLEQKAEIEYVEELFTKAVKAGLIIPYLEPPRDFLVKVPVETAFLRGNKKARIMFLEFSDYQCPFCSRVQPTITILRNHYENKVVFGYRHSPLPFHREADEAAIAAECARDQGKFVEYHNLLFENPTSQFNTNLKQFAKQLQLKNQGKFEECLDKEVYRPRLERDIEVATLAGIRGTPGFVIGLYNAATGIVSGEIISGAQPQAVFVDAIEKYLNQLN
jgi:protein-disulfide isomerase